MEYPCWAIADDGPAAGQVFEVEPRRTCVKLLCDDGTHRYVRLCFGASKKNWRIAHFSYVDSLVI